MFVLAFSLFIISSYCIPQTGIERNSCFQYATNCLHNTRSDNSLHIQAAATPY